MGFFDLFTGDLPEQRLARLRVQEEERKIAEQNAIRATGVNYLKPYMDPETAGATPQTQQRNLLSAAAARGAETTPDGMNRRVTPGGSIFGYDSVPTPDLMNAAFPEQAMARQQAAAFPAKIDPDKRFKTAADGTLWDVEPTGGGEPKRYGDTKPEARPEVLKMIDAYNALSPTDPRKPQIKAWIDKNTSDLSDERRALLLAQTEDAKSNTTLHNAQAKGAADGSLSPETLDMMTDQLLAGDPSPMQGLGYGNVGAANRAKLREALAKKAADKGISGADQAAINAEYFGIKAGERVLGGRSANIDMAVNEADQFADLALDSSTKVPRGRWVPVNKAMLAWNANSGDTATRAFGAANNSFINAYATAVGKGTMTVDAVQHARELLSTADGPEAYKAIIAQLKKEMAAAKASPGIVRKDMRNAITGTEGKPAAPAPGAYTWTPGGGIAPK